MVWYENSIFWYVCMWCRKNKFTGTLKKSQVCTLNILFCKKKGDIKICVAYAKFIHRIYYFVKRRETSKFVLHVRSLYIEYIIL